MYKVHLIYDVPGWAYYWRCMALQKYAPEDFEVSIGMQPQKGHPIKRYDLILQLCYCYTSQLREQLAYWGHDDTIVVSGYNVGYDDYNSPWLTRLQLEADHIIINSRLAWERARKRDKCSWISNGVDLEKFRVTTPPETRKPRIIFLGSLFHTEKDRDTKGYWSHLMPLKERLERRGIETDFQRTSSFGAARVNANGVVLWKDGYLRENKLVAWYNTGTVYVVASHSEGTPNPALEAAACGNVVVATRVGNMPELIEPSVNGELVEREVDALEEAVVRCQERYTQMSAAMLERIKVWDWRLRAQEYYRLFRRLIESDSRGTSRQTSEVPSRSESVA